MIDVRRYTYIYHRTDILAGENSHSRVTAMYYHIIYVPYSEKFSCSAKLRVFRGLVGMCAKINKKFFLNRWSKYDVTVSALGSTNIWAWSHVRRAQNFCWRLHGRLRENLHPRKFPAIRYLISTEVVHACTMQY